MNKWTNRTTDAANACFQKRKFVGDVFEPASVGNRHGVSNESRCYSGSVANDAGDSNQVHSWHDSGWPNAFEGKASLSVGVEYRSRTEPKDAIRGAC